MMRRKEAVLPSAIEGASSTLSDLPLLESDQAPAPLGRRISVAARGYNRSVIPYPPGCRRRHGNHWGIGLKEAQMEKRIADGALLQTISLMPGMVLHIADFKPFETIEDKFETTNAVLRFYFHRSVSGFWELHSPFIKGAQNKKTHSGQVSFAFFYPELEGRVHFPAAQHQSHVSIYITPELLNNYLGGSMEMLPYDFREVAQGSLQMGFSHDGPLSRMMSAAVDDLLKCPYTGPMQQLYMESKAVELIAHKIAQLCLPEHAFHSASGLHPRDAERISHARDILCADLENPPKLHHLARSAGINHSKLNIGFREIYGTTVFGYLRRMRLLEARRLLDKGDMNVTETALSVGYSSLPSFSKAFSEFFGISPAHYLKNQ
jgi:AraC family transcriptional activator of pyochelin receptor